MRTALLLGLFYASADQAKAQVVQLPTFRSFQYQGSVLVPDQGTASLGGNSGAALGRTRSRFGGRSSGQSLFRSQPTISATIIDNQAMDRQILGGTPEQFLERRRAERANSADARSPIPLTRTEVGKALVRQARGEYTRRDTASAFVTYRRALSYLDGHLLSYASNEFRRRYGAAADQVIRQAAGNAGIRQ
ncbi:MAG: hypothetical protein AAGA03_00240 [Planctomycetota bacterium]